MKTPATVGPTALDTGRAGQWFVDVLPRPAGS